MGVPLNRKGIEGLPYHFLIHLNAHIHTSFYSFDYHRECAVASEVPDVDCIPTDWNKLIVIYMYQMICHFYPIPHLPSDTVPPQMCHKYSIFTQCVLL